MSRSTAKRVMGAVLALSALFATAAGADETTPGPAWRLTLTPISTNFSPSATGSNTGQVKTPYYQVVAVNVGGGPTSSGSTLEVSLPPGITPIGTVGQGIGASANFSVPACAIAGQAVTCSTPSVVKSGRWIGARIAVQTAATPGDSIAEASVSGGGAKAVTVKAPSRISAEPAAFDFLPGSGGLRSMLTRGDGSPAQQAGSHPDQVTIDTGFPTIARENSAANSEHPKDIVTEFPPGLVINPQATPVKCTESELQFLEPGKNNCPEASQVGLVFTTTVVSGGSTVAVSPLYNMVPPPGVPAQLAFEPANVGIYVHVQGQVRSDGDYGITGVVEDTIARTNNPIFNVQVHLWGDPSSAEHDNIRGECRARTGSADFGNCPVERQSTPFVTLPSACSGTLPVSLSADSWEHPGSFASRTANSVGLGDEALGVNGCSLLDFEPSFTLHPDTSSAESPAGVSVDLHIPQHEDLDELATSNLRNATVTLPEGMAVNPASAGGLDACTPTQVGLITPVGQADPIHFTNAPDNCPNAAKIGSVQVITPLLDHPLAGDVYVASPQQNPFGTLLAIYIAIKSPDDGIFVKLAGKVEADPSTGQLKTTFTENPQLPVEDFKLDFFGGPRAALRTPSDCGSFATTGSFTPWSGNAPVDTSDSFKLNSGANAGPCSSSESQRPNAPGFEAGTRTPVAASYSPFVMNLRRQDGQQLIKGLDLTLPPGLTGKLAGIGRCTDAQIAAAGAKSGREEQASPSCPAASQVGEVTVGAGAGSQPYFTKGKIYLAGPYKGAPLSFAIITPAVAGPYDLGDVVVRAAAFVDPVTTKITVKSDPLPTILQGIPLQVRDIRVEMNRNEFTLNPSSCDPLAIEGAAFSPIGTTQLSNRFQVGGCKGLDFTPKLALRLKGGTKRASHPKLIATLTAKPGEANIARAQVKLPPSAFLDQAHIRTVCTRVQYAADACPKGSIYGTATARTPLLDEPLSGNVYLRSSNHKLPDLVMDLRGPDYLPIRIELSGKTDSVKGALRNTFEAIPDAPVSKFTLELFGGKRGLVINSRNLCAHRYRAEVKLDGQNGKAHDTKPVVQSDCRGKKHR